jgi:hypothetical protein
MGSPRREPSSMKGKLASVDRALRVVLHKCTIGRAL